MGISTMSSESLAPDGKSSALSVGQSQSSSTELLFEDSVFLTEKFDDSILLTADPTGQGGDENLPGLHSDGHPGIVARERSTRQLSLAVQVGLFFPRIGSAE